MKPRMFIASSVEQVDLAYAVQEGLEQDVEPTVWNQGVFKLSADTMASLLDELDECDFGVFVLAPDDVTVMREKVADTVRDNVLFELGLFVGRLGRDRCFVVRPKGTDNLHLPTDLVGLSPATFDPLRQDKNLVAAVGPACNRIRKAVRNLGTLKKTTEQIIDSKPAEKAPGASIDNPADCKILLRHWFGSQPSSRLAEPVFFAEVERALGIKAGLASLYIDDAAAFWNFSTVEKGEKVVLFADKNPDPYS